MRLKLGEQTIIIPPEMLAQVMSSGVPGWLVGTEPCKTGLQMAIKRGLKSFMPGILDASHAFFRDASIPAPDLKSAQAKQNIILYGLTYLLAASTYITDQADFVVEGVTQADGTVVVTGVDASIPSIADSDQTSELSGNGQPAIAAPAIPQES